MSNLTLALDTLAYGLIGLYFVFFGFWNIHHWSNMISIMIERKIPSPLFILSLMIGLQIIAGIMIIFHILSGIVALCLIPFILMIVGILHPFWHFEGELRKQHMALFITNITMCLGALLLLATHAT